MININKITTIGNPILSGTFNYIKDNISCFLNKDIDLFKNSSCRTLLIYEKGKGFVDGYILKQENRIWNLYETESIKQK